MREIAKRLLVGLEEQIPDLQERINHIFTQQLYGIAITELTAYLSRRSLYCSKAADGKYSVSTLFDTPEGNLRYRPMQHTWENGKCKYCGASQAVYDRASDLETHAYEFIHTNPQTLYPNMTFDVIIGNPPYQLEVGIEKDNYSIPLYHKFVEQAKKLKPNYLVMIIPSRWFAGGRGLDDFRTEMLSDNHIQRLVDYPDATDCFPGVDISGGVCYFLWNKHHQGICEITTSMERMHYSSTMKRPLLEVGNDSFIRWNEAIPIIDKIQALNEKSFADLVSPQTPFGIVSSFNKYREDDFPNSIAIHTVKGKKYTEISYITKNYQWVKDHKVYISKSYGERGLYPYRFLAKPFLGEQNSCCTQTYLMIGPWKNSRECENVISYIQTKFFRFLVMQKKNTQDAMRGVYQFVPLQDFSKPWTDEELYKKYNLTDEEIVFIESMIKPME